MNTNSLSNVKKRLAKAFVLLAVLVPFVAFSQTANLYVLSQSNDGVLDNMSGATTFSGLGAGVNDVASSVTNIGFTFVYEGTSYTQFSANSNGLMRLGGTVVSNTATNGITTASNQPKIMPLWDDLNTGTGGSVKYLLTGSSPNRILKVQWQTRNQSGESGAYTKSFQVWLYETTNEIAFIYGTGTNATSASIGIGGTSASNYISVSSSVNGMPAASSSTANDANTVWPGSGKKYLFSPRNCLSQVPTVSNSGPICNGANATLTASGMAPGGAVAVLSGTNSITSGNNSLTNVSNSFTIEFWANPTGTITASTCTPSETNTGSCSSTSSNNQRFAIFPDSRGSNAAGVGISVGTNGVSVYERGTSYFPCVLQALTPLSGWNHIAVVYTNKTPSLYINGSYVRTGATSSRTTVYPSLGTGGNIGYYTGSLDNIRIWNSAKSQADLRSDMFREVATLGTPTYQYTFNGSNTNAYLGGVNNSNSGATFAAASFYTYTWSGTGAPAASNSETQTTSAISSNQVFTVIPSATNYCNGTGNSTTVTVTTGPTILTQPQPASSCGNSSINFSIVGSGIITGYQWQYDDGTQTTWTNFTGNLGSSGYSTQTLTLANPQTNLMDGKSVRCIITSAAGCRVSSSASITIGTLPNAPTVNTPTSATSICPGASINLRATSSGNTINWYTSSTGGTSIGSSASNVNFAYTPSSTGVYYAETETPTGCKSTSRSATAQVTLYAEPAMPTVTPTTKCGVGTLNVTATSGAGGNTVRWYTAASGGSAFLTNTSNSLSFSDFGTTYTYYLTSYNTTNTCESNTRTEYTFSAGPNITATTSVNQTTCSGNTVTLTSSGTSQVYYTNTTSVAIPDNNNTGVNSTISVSGLNPATVNSATVVGIRLNIAHARVGQLEVRLTSPAGTSLLLINNRGGNNANFTNTVLVAGGANGNVSAGSVPFTGFYVPEAAFTGFNSGNINGNWVLNVRDLTNGTTGTLTNWSLILNTTNNINYNWTGQNLSATNTQNTTATPTSTNNYVVTLSDGAGSGCSASASSTVTINNPTANAAGPNTVCQSATPSAITLAGASVGGSATTGAWSIVSGGGTLSNTAQTSNPAAVTYTPAANFNGTVTLLLTTNQPSGCTAGTSTRTINVTALPSVTITPDYCLGTGQVKLTATSGSSYLWSTGATTQFILADLAGAYNVTVTNASGCAGTATFNLSTELVVNGNFSSGNTGFTTSYNLNQSANGLVPEGNYAVGTNANFHHSNFWGPDHTTGTGNYLMVNGSTSATPAVVWQQTVAVTPNTTYYLSAWARSLNNVAPYAQLRFNVNGTQVGTTAVLTAGASSNSGPFTWTRFYATWSSGSNTSVTLSVVNLQSSAGGNDFGLDDISCSTLAPETMTVTLNSSGSAVCEGSTIALSSTVTGGASPLSYSWVGPGGYSASTSSINRSGANNSMAGNYSLIVTDSYNCTASNSNSVAVNAKPVVTPTVNPTQVCSGSNATLDAGALPGSGTITTYQWNTGIVGNNAGGTVTPLVATTYTVTVTNSNGCSTTASVALPLKASSTIPSSITASENFVGCVGDPITITINGGALGDGAKWKLYTNSCGGSFQEETNGSGFVVTPSATTQYFVRAEGDCNNTLCRNLTIKFNEPDNIVDDTKVKSCTYNGTVPGEKYMIDEDNHVLLGINEGTVNLGNVIATTTIYGTTAPSFPNSNGCATNELFLPRKFDITSSASQPFTDYVTVNLYFSADEFNTLKTATENAGADYVNCWGLISTPADLMVTIIHGPNDYEVRTQGGGGLTISNFTLPNNSNIYKASFQVNRFSEFFIHGSGNSNALPVTWMGVKASAVNNRYIQVDWSTAMEIDNSGFAVERSIDGTNWSSIGWVAGNNNSNTQSNYSYNDYSIEPGTRYYYRLKQVDNDGDYDYSVIVSAIINASSSISSVSVSPNPTQGKTIVRFESTVDGELSLNVTNMFGQSVYNSKHNVLNGANEIESELGHLPSGAYTMLLQSETEVRSIKFVIHH